MAGPALQASAETPIQRTARVSFQFAENVLRPLLRSHHYVDVGCSNVNSVERPALVRAHFLNRAQYSFAGAGVKGYGFTGHEIGFVGHAQWTRFEIPRAEVVVGAVNRTSLVSVEPITVTGEGKEIRQGWVERIPGGCSSGMTPA